jgi:hypothetical protein
LQDPVSKITKAKRAGDMAQVAEPLLKRKALSLNPSIAKKKKKRKKKKKDGGREKTLKRQ